VLLDPLTAVPAGVLTTVTVGAIKESYNAYIRIL